MLAECEAITWNVGTFGVDANEEAASALNHKGESTDATPRDGAPRMALWQLKAPSASYFQLAPSRPHESVNDRSLPVLIQAAMRQDIELSLPEEREHIIAKVAALDHSNR